jgi:transcriptional regulator with XRE-family HTH domain
MTNSAKLKIRMKKLGVLLKDARAISGKSLEECATAIGITTERMDGFERGEFAPSLPELETLAYFLNVPLTHFWDQNTVSSQQEAEVSAPNLQRLIPLRNRIVGVLLRKSRLEAGCSLLDLSKQANISQENITEYESGDKAIPLPELEILSKSLNLNIDFFLDKNGVVGEWSKQQRAVQAFLEMPANLQDFVTKPINKPYLEIARRLSDMNVERLRSLAEGLLDITL